jgi:hypothetical protein
MIASDTISIRLATPDDAAALARLAALDSSRAPAGPVLLAECEGELRAALSLTAARRRRLGRPPVSGTTVIADPFVRTAELVRLLELRAAGLARAVRYGATNPVADPSEPKPWYRTKHRLTPRLPFAGRTASG